MAAFAPMPSASDRIATAVKIGAAPQQPQTVPRVADDVVDDLDPATIAAGFFMLLQAAHRAQCRMTGIFAGSCPVRR